MISVCIDGVSGDEDDGRSDHGSPASSQLDTDGEVDAIRRVRAVKWQGTNYQ